MPNASSNYPQILIKICELVQFEIPYVTGIQTKKHPKWMGESVFIRLPSFLLCFDYNFEVMNILSTRLNVLRLVIIWRKNIKENGDCPFHKVLSSVRVK